MISEKRCPLCPKILCYLRCVTNLFHIISHIITQDMWKSLEDKAFTSKEVNDKSFE